MIRAPKSPSEGPAPSASDPEAVLQLKVWLIGVSPMVWRRVLVPAAFTLRELHGVFQVLMGWEGHHLFQFGLRAGRYGSWELSASSPDVTLAALQLRKGARFSYEYDLNIPWEHEVRVEDRLMRAPALIYPTCVGGSSHCPPEDCGGPERFMTHREDATSWEAMEEFRELTDVLGEVAISRKAAPLDEEFRWRLERAVEHGARTRAGPTFRPAVGECPPAEG
jgi:hypothetical protein